MTCGVSSNMKIENLKEYVERSMNGVDIVSTELDSLVDSVVSKSCKELDDYIIYVKELLDDESRPITNVELDDIVMTIPTPTAIQKEVRRASITRMDPER